jgi:tetrahydromethanopterin S-methyltransferase subunit F
LNRDKEMQNARVKALIITNYCGLSSLLKPDTVRRALCSYVKMDSWLIKQSESIETDIDIFGATISTVDGSPAEKRRVRKYQTDFLTFGFTYQLVKVEERPQCVVCVEVLANNSFNARNLCRHLTTKHESLANKPLQSFERKMLGIRKQSNLMRIAVTTSTKALLASFEVSYLIAKNKKPHAIGETLLLPAAMEMYKIMHGEEYGEALKTIPLSNNTAMRRIESMSKDIKEQLLTRIKRSPKFAVKIDESTGVAGLVQLLVFFRYCFEEKIQEEFMFCLPLSERCTGSDIFKAVNDFTAEDISWGNCIDICTDGAEALTRHKKGFQAEVQQIGPHVNFIVSFIERL